MSASEKKEKLDFIREIIAKDLKSGKHDTVVTRFPPEPNGYLHIGHAKAICFNFGIAQENQDVNARCHLRFDDTNPAKEEAEYVDSIKKDVSWLGFDWGENLYFASDYFDFFYDCAVHLIKEGKAYVDEQSLEEIRETRGNVTTPGTHSPFRDRPVEESLDLFARMKAGEFENGKMVLRAKIDMSSSNMNMRDPVMYRIVNTPHHNTGDSWCIYPMYDFAHPLEDAKEHITHSLCTLEFENHRPLYEWAIENCPVPSQPRQIEFSRLNLSYTVMSKRKLLQLVEEGRVSGWNDPRLPTLSGMRRRGYQPAAIRSFCHRVGITKVNSVTDMSILEAEIRNELNQNAERRMGVLDPLKVVITNWPSDDHSEKVTVPNNPANDAAGTREVSLGKEIWIERDDFMEDPPKKFFRLGPDRSVRLRGGYIITCTGFEKNDAGEVTEIHCEFIPDTIGKDAPEGIRCRAAIHWVDAATAVTAEVRLYDRLFSEENPDAAEDGFLSCLNTDSLSVITNAKLEASLADVPAEAVFQFERVGYFCTDNVDHVTGEKIVFNRTVALKDSWRSK
ncbi:glutamine--tRNA ligase/YqeY domain fusion protein [Verrucomicrobiaceae bacterium 5K15]|uniref:Glutamine--tRNA ligase n=1 Tax=Oceaniferula flava TaxID=2800421 RepID=A0AAE2SB32_9BACT|nr:glutamine--tRNA ligase/YqeY domain fusion protein [Oceaniferula flavus]MBK1854603.1 glutamine--tRNA ligase/YqeY domain fusion protein [Oceaniferula flavus]MBM1135909.1 glutamine--tRNA ligase/YqeY domain fusion protein [Oceaniferula flavus]